MSEEGEKTVWLWKLQAVRKGWECVLWPQGTPLLHGTWASRPSLLEGAALLRVEERERAKCSGLLPELTGTGRDEREGKNYLRMRIVMKCSTCYQMPKRRTRRRLLRNSVGDSKYCYAYDFLAKVEYKARHRWSDLLSLLGKFKSWPAICLNAWFCFSNCFKENIERGHRITLIGVQVPPRRRRRQALFSIHSFT